MSKLQETINSSEYTSLPQELKTVVEEWIDTFKKYNFDIELFISETDAIVSGFYDKTLEGFDVCVNLDGSIEYFDIEQGLGADYKQVLHDVKPDPEYILRYFKQIMVYTLQSVKEQNLENTG